MRLTQPLLRLPLRFDADRLADEIAALPAEAWVPHPNKLPGNEAALLVTTDGAMTDDIASPMAPTRFLRACPYVMETMAAIGAVWGRSRLMRLAPGASVPPHVDTNFYWRTHVRVHVPIVTTPDVRFSCAGRTVHMAPGECWIFDTFSMHQVRNDGPVSRTHLVLDTVGGVPLYDLIDAATAGAPDRVVTPGTVDAGAIAFEQARHDPTMSPWELRHHVAFIGEQAMAHPLLDTVMKRLDRFCEGWAAVWAQVGNDPAGVGHYRALMATLDADLQRIGGQAMLLRNRLPVYRQVAELLFTADAGLARTSAVLPAFAAR